MKFIQSFTEERAVSPVIGVILMVAITVILAAVIGTFVLGLGDSVSSSAPQATLSVSAGTSDDTITIEHNGGDALHSDRTRVVMTIQTAAGTSSHTFDPATVDGTLSVGGTSTWDVFDNDGVGAGTDVVAVPSSGLTGYTDASIADFDSGDTITVKLIDTESQKVIFETEVTA